MAFGSVFLKDVPESHVKKVTEGGVVKDVPYTVYRKVKELAEQKIALKEGQVFDAEGAELAPAEAIKRLTPGVTLVISADGQEVAPSFLRILKPDAVVVVLPVAPPPPLPQPILVPAPREAPAKIAPGQT